MRPETPQPPLYSPRMNKTAGLGVVVISVLALTGCGASGAQAPTRHIKQVSDGVEATSGSIDIRDLLLVSQPDGSAALVATFINQDTAGDSLTGITVGEIPVVITPASLPLLQNTPVIFSGDSANATGVVPALNVPAGSRADVVVTFAHAPSVKLSAIVRAKTDYFSSVGGEAVPSASPSPSATK